jgi:hypothetical protein
MVCSEIHTHGGAHPRPIWRRAELLRTGTQGDISEQTKLRRLEVPPVGPADQQLVGGP